MFPKALSFYFLCICLPGMAQWQPDVPTDLTQKAKQARSLRVEGKYQEAEALFLETVAEYPNYYRAHYNLAIIYVYTKNFEKAEESMAKALEIRKRENISEYSIFNTAGWMKMNQGDYEEAIVFFKQALAAVDHLSERTRSRLYNNLGISQIYTDDYFEAGINLNIADKKYSNRLAKGNLKLLRSFMVWSISQKSTIQMLVPESKDQAVFEVEVVSTGGTPIEVAYKIKGKPCETAFSCWGQTILEPGDKTTVKGTEVMIRQREWGRNAWNKEDKGQGHYTVLSKNSTGS